jgi:hypothetical protein
MKNLDLRKTQKSETQATVVELSVEQIRRVCGGNTGGSSSSSSAGNGGIDTDGPRFHFSASGSRPSSAIGDQR